MLRHHARPVSVQLVCRFSRHLLVTGLLTGTARATFSDSGAPTFMPERMRGASGGPACTHHRWIRAPPPERADDLDAFFKEIDEEPDYDWIDLPSGRYVL